MLVGVGARRGRGCVRAARCRPGGHRRARGPIPRCSARGSRCRGHPPAARLERRCPHSTAPATSNASMQTCALLLYAIAARVRRRRLEGADRLLHPPAGRRRRGRGTRTAATASARRRRPRAGRRRAPSPPAGRRRPPPAGRRGSTRTTAPRRAARARVAAGGAAARTGTARPPRGAPRAAQTARPPDRRSRLTAAESPHPSAWYDEGRARRARRTARSAPSAAACSADRSAGSSVPRTLSRASSCRNAHPVAGRRPAGRPARTRRRLAVAPGHGDQQRDVGRLAEDGGGAPARAWRPRASREIRASTASRTVAGTVPPPAASTSVT